MIAELYTDLEQLYYRRKEDIRKLEEAIRKLEAKLYIPKEAKETSEPSKDRKLYWELRKHPYQRSTQELSDQETYTSRFIRPRGETNSTLPESSHFFFLLKKIPRSGKY